ncbi:crotonase/enoyl-CoA hydratase family protein [Rhodococcus pseudokoreensis]|uniref:Crotonase/enoyl-CoA hydratase family protein n=1 Tax=Rhodococcus pseudokoreensis TaxID=2811421 RepID=A0A974ZUK8_9NOCA|nr:crotonase/enoyl-CoA hydratase family protein [Rhodococcus pseudokoreensis]QSE90806.1 crotonase/enoyl-CoA hydratase family protein [Rhodococcus pseudokoreensis]
MTELADEVLTEFADGIALITINRPKAKNAMTAAAAAAIADAIDTLEQRADLTVGIITGAGGVFCAGMDLKAFTRGESPSIAGRGFGGLTESPPTKPLIAAIEGWALAGGCELALSADLVVAARTARFGLPEVKRGLVATAGGLLRLPKALPYPVAMRIALTGEPISAEEAERFGLVSILCEEGEALSAAKDLAATIAANGPLAVRATKQIVSEAAGWTDADAFESQRAIARPAMKSADAREGALAFAEKRSPVWRGE